MPANCNPATQNPILPHRHPGVPKNQGGAALKILRLLFTQEHPDVHAIKYAFPIHTIICH
jgi:hypothetical protein